jgi:nucleotide-binding universal stress UspA family protein
MATDGTERSDGALKVAAARSARMGATLELISVVRTEPVVGREGLQLVDDELLLRLASHRKKVEEQVARVLGKDTVVSITVIAGNPAHTISRVAIERRVSLVVVGLGRHTVPHRLIGDEVALQLARIARVPMLAVPGITGESPRLAVVAIDFSEISARAAQLAIETVADDGAVHLVHVMPFVHEDAFAVEAREPYAQWAEEQLTALRAQLVVPDGITVSQVCLRGRPAHALVGYANRVGADVVVTGTHGRGFVARTILGSVTTQLIRGVACMLMTTPRDPLPALAATGGDAAHGQSDEAPMSWSVLLAEFTKRNAGRRTILEVDDLELGAQAQEYNYPLIGTSYSERDGRVDLILGDRFAGGRHLSRTMGSVVAVDVLTDGAGHDVALRVQHGRSQTLLTFAA